MNRIVAASLIVVLLGGCQTVGPAPSVDYSLIDPKGVDMAKYSADWAECSALANQANTASSAAGGAVVGAVIGGVFGALLCGRSCAQAGAAWGGGYGAGSGAVAAVRDQQFTLRGCLANRGYAVIR